MAKAGYETRINIVNDESIKKISKHNMDIWEEFKNDMILQKGDKAENTLKTYRSAVLAYMIWLAENYDNMDFEKVDHKIFKKYLFYCQSMGNNGKIRNLKTSAVSSIFNYLVREDIIDFNPLLNKLRRADTSDEVIIQQPFLDSSQIDQLRLEINKIENYHKRMLYSVYLELAISSLARIGAIIQFGEDNLDLKNRVFNEIREKRSKLVDLTFSVKAHDLLVEWIEYKKKIGVDTPAIFFSKVNG